MDRYSPIDIKGFVLYKEGSNYILIKCNFYTLFILPLWANEFDVIICLLVLLLLLLLLNNFFLLYFPYKNPYDGAHGAKKEMLSSLVTMMRRECHGVVRRRAVVVASKEAVRVNYFLFLLFPFFIYDVFLSFREKECGVKPFLYKLPLTNSFLIFLRPQNSPTTTYL